MNWRRLFKRLVMDSVHEATKQGRRALQKRAKAAPTTVRPSPGDLQEPKPSKQHSQPETPAPGGPYPGDFTGHVEPVYDPHVDGVPDPGEIVWTWVPYEEDHSQGKDRPVLLIGRDGDWLIGLQVTSKDHDVDAAQEARAGRYWVDIGSGDWDRKRRPSEVRVNRFLRIDPNAVRRIGAILDRERFDEVAEGIARWA
ncbi:type II toxin-antitoxin system PemK/MazF family toxin [uncultured Tessaracoccus sp.]|uniref:type II toxin-antitoxin system PemK/MazF family toxin n=1 Tax=uncultured Tessaracoccus sp. TaxID=905023 RepID=UPI0026097F94|nr:type II toxin-antitoxin system PemK/MazF family toxin [uncultured Tessaracoccus sp.]